MPRSTTERAGILLAASLTVDPDRLAAMWQMSPQERTTAAHRGELSLGEMCRWAARYPHEVEIVNGEFFFLAALEPEFAEAPDADA
jgi:hypothetical protein